MVSNLHTICPSAILSPPPVTLSCVTVGLEYTRLSCFLMISEIILAAVGLIRRVYVVEAVFFLESHASGFQLLVGSLGGRGLRLIFEKISFFSGEPSADHPGGLPGWRCAAGHHDHFLISLSRLWCNKGFFFFFFPVFVFFADEVEDWRM